MTTKNLYSNNFDMGVKKAEFYADFEFVEKVEEKTYKKLLACK
jgi:hypothetical protein